jgi:hypothetical protein
MASAGAESDELEESITTTLGGPGLLSTSPSRRREGAGTDLIAENRRGAVGGLAGSTTYLDRQSTRAFALEEMWCIS